MRKIIVLALAVIGGYFVYTRMGVHEKFSGLLEPQITISDLKSSSVFADSLVELRNLRVTETQSLLNYSRSKVSDASGEEMIVLSNHPFRTNESIDVIRGRFTVVYADNARRCEVFISEDLNLFHDFMTVLKHSLM